MDGISSRAPSRTGQRGDEPSGHSSEGTNESHSGGRFTTWKLGILASYKEAGTQGGTDWQEAVVESIKEQSRTD